MKKMIAVLILLSIVSASIGQGLVSVDFDSDIVPTVAISDKDITKVAKVAVGGIKARTDTDIILRYQDVAYAVRYGKETGYLVYTVPVLEDVRLGMLQQIESYLEGHSQNFVTTRVSDVRTWVLQEIIAQHQKAMTYQ